MQTNTQVRSSLSCHLCCHLRVQPLLRTKKWFALYARSRTSSGCAFKVQRNAEFHHNVVCQVQTLTRLAMITHIEMEDLALLAHFSSLSGSFILFHYLPLLLFFLILKQVRDSGNFFILCWFSLSEIEILMRGCLFWKFMFVLTIVRISRSFKWLWVKTKNEHKNILTIA